MLFIEKLSEEIVQDSPRYVRAKGFLSVLIGWGVRGSY